MSNSHPYINDQPVTRSNPVPIEVVNNGAPVTPGVATIADNADVAQGATTDAAVITDAPGTISGKLRGLVAWAYTRMPASLGQKTKAASLPVVLASDQDALTVTVSNPTTNPETGLAKDGTDISSPTAMPAGGVGIRGWLSAIWTKLNASIAVTGTFWQATQPISGSVTADTELPAAVLLADNAALPTAPTVGAVNYVYDGATLDMARSANAATATAGDGVPAAGLMVYNSLTSQWVRINGRNSSIGANSEGLLPIVVFRQGYAEPSITSITDNATTFYGGAVSGALLYNNTGWDRQRNNAESTVAASAARTTTLTTADQINYNGRALKLYINVSAYTAGGLTPVIQGKDPVSGTYFTLLTGAKIVATGLVVMEINPQLPAVANLIAQAQLGRTWRVVCTPDDATSITYSIGAVTFV